MSTTNHPTDGIRITGTLTSDVALMYTAEREPSALMVFELRPDVGAPYSIRFVVGKDPSAQIAASAKAHALRRGAQVSVYAKGLRIHADHGAVHLMALGVTDVFPLSIPSGHGQPATQKD